MEMPGAIHDQLIAYIREMMPEEACGLIAGQDDRAVRLYPVENRLHSPSAYEMEPLAQIQAMLAIEAAGWDMLGIFHSHPHSPALPSPTDLAQAYYPDCQYVIVSLQDPDRPASRAFYLREGRAEEVHYLVV
jgi:proteasome lid subunit RPN8/RPN11